MAEEFPLFIPSYGRPGAPTIRLAQRHLGSDYPWWVVVRKSQAEDYLDAGLPSDNMMAVADSKIDSLGKTRNHILKWAYSHGYFQIFDWDDDITNIGFKADTGSKYVGSRIRSEHEIPWLNGPDFWIEASRIASETFEEFPSAVVGSVQNQRWATLATLQVQCGKTPRRTKIVNVERLVDNELWCPEEFWIHGEDIGNTAMYLQEGFQVFTICNLIYGFVPEHDAKLPSTLRDKDEEKNRAIHAAELECLMSYDIKDYLRVNKHYDDGSYMYGDVNWQKFRNLTGQESYLYEFSHVFDAIPISDIPYETLLPKG